jgi:iron-sulfur cluster assembly accessory protein
MALLKYRGCSDLTTPLAAGPGAPYLGAMDIALSSSAAKRVAWIAQRQQKPAILRLAVEGGGCSGFQYRFGLADAAETDDVVVETDGVRLVVDSMSLDLVRGGIVDFVDNLGGAAFKVENPNATAGCGCGSSFSV